MQECGECTLCCQLLEIKETESNVCENCKHVIPDKGCTIYISRPQECRNFQCSWSLHKQAHKNMRPDKCHMIFENINENIVLGTLDPNYKLNDLLMAQIQAFQQAGNSIVLQLWNEPVKIIPVNTTAEIVWKTIKEKMDDRTKLHNKSEHIRPS